jgi:hypothetical protein
MNTTHTSQSIENLAIFQDEVTEKIAGRQQLNFQIGDLEVKEASLVLDNRKLDTDATKKILGHLKVRPDFLSLHKKMTEEDWETVSDKLKSVHANQFVYGRTAGENNDAVIDVQLAHKKAPNGGIQIPEIFGLLNESLLNSSADDYKLTETYFDTQRDSVSLTLLQTDREIDVFGNGTDMWKVGKRITWSSIDFNISPFCERLVCTNGNVAKQYGFSANVSKSKYNFAKIHAILEKEIANAADSVTPMLTESAKHLKKNNVSIKEFLQYRNFFNEEEHSHILKKYFDISYLNTAYRCDIEGMHHIWKSTADTGKNAYDFFNDLTYIASHPSIIKLDETKRRELQIKASDFLFKEVLDLENVAPKISFVKK